VNGQALLADLVLVLHLGFVLFVVLGGLLALRWRWAPAIHLPAALWGVYIEASGGMCPLTPLENALRQSAGESGYAGGFIEHYLMPVLYPSWLNLPTQIVLASLVVIINAIIYGFAWRRHLRNPAR
jgi:hypothetical protein